MSSISFAPLALRTIALVLPLTTVLACNGDKDGDSGSGGDGGATDGGTADGGTDGGTDGGSGDGGTSGDPAVVVTGAVYVQTGTSVTLTATTINATDSAYTWSSGDDGVASVDGGTVTGVSPGEVWITATGVDSMASGTIGLYVSNEIPHYDQWAGSGHADYSAEAFNHWNEDGEISSSCARCHSTPGFMDYIGADGSKPDSIESAAPLGTVVECEACHNDVANDLSHVVFPSGVEIDGLGGEARCMTCHQGRGSKDDVDDEFLAVGASIADAPDAVNDELGFENIHYYPAGATLYAGEVRGGYQYDDAVYDWRFRHVSGGDVCIECHDPHSLEVQTDVCSTCHEGVTAVDDLKDVRMIASLSSDYDGDGDTSEGIYYEIDGLKTALLDSIQQYTVDQGLGAICYHTTNYPYFFIDTDSNGDCSDDEGEYSNAFASWTPRLVAAAYNYQMAAKDPGNFAHNAKYTIQLLHDSLQDLNEGLSTPKDLSVYDRDDPGHFNGAGEAARHWDEDETISSSCSSCHGGAEGLHFYLEYGVGLSGEEPDNGLECETCHTDIPTYETLVSVDSVTFPNDVTVDNDDGDPSFVCMSCHRGRESGADIDAAIASGSLSFKNIHYLPAGATRYGADVGVGYQYDDLDYAGAWTGHPGGDSCTSCHNPVTTDHTFKVADGFDSCSTCHGTATEAGDIRGSGHAADYDGDGDASEPLAGELEGMAARLYTVLQANALLVGQAICYDSHAYPYFFNDTDVSGACEEDEATYSNSYSSWNDAMLKAAFNYQYYQKEPGAWAHNFDYMGQLLFDSVSDMGGSTVLMVRPDAD